MAITIKEKDVIEAARRGNEAFVRLFADRTLQSIGGELTAETMRTLTADQITLLAYWMMREEVMTGGFIQLIHNGYGSFIFFNPFAKAMRLWGAHDFSKMLYYGRELFEKYGDELTRDCTEEEFMALYEQYPDFEDLDDEFIDEMEEEVTELVAHYIDEHMSHFAVVQGGE